MAAGADTVEFKSRVDNTYDNLEVIRIKLLEFNKILGIAKTAIDTVDTIGDVAEKMKEAIDDQLLVIKVTEKAGPLSTPSKAFKKVLEAVRPVADKIDKAVDKLNGKQDKNKDGEEEDGEFLDDLSDAIEDSMDYIKTAVQDIEAQQKSLDDLSKTVGAYVEALDVATEPGQEWNDAFVNLNRSVDLQFRARNDAADDLDAAFGNVVSKIDSAVKVLGAANLGVTVDAGTDLEKIEAFFDAIGKPLSIAAAALKPIEPILNAVGVLVDLVLTPVFDFITKTLGIDKLLDTIADKIEAILPGSDSLDALLEEAQDMIDDMREFIRNNYSIEEFMDRVEASLFGDAVGDAEKGPTGWGDDNNNTVLLGDAGDDILDGRKGDDDIYGGGGNDIFISSEGEDELYGGSGIDMVYFDGLFNEYELARTPEGRVVVTHVEPPRGAINQGSATLYDVDWVVFRNITFSGEELENADIGGSTLVGSNGDDLMFLNSSAPLSDRDANGNHVARGLGGNDRIFGSTESDALYGGSGNDVFVPGGQADSVFGGTGTDTFQILGTDTDQDSRADLIDGQVITNGGSTGEGTDTLSSVENLILQNLGNHLVKGNDLDNILSTTGGKDVIIGRGGDDVIEGGDDTDFLFGGDGWDQIRGGRGNDYINGRGDVIPGKAEYFDGGEGGDIMSYTSDGNIVSKLLITNSSSVNARSISAGKEAVTAAGPLRIYAETGKVEHLDGDGNVIRTDNALNFESFVGSDKDDVIYGKAGGRDVFTTVHGAGGDDVIYTDGVNVVLGGDGDDIVNATIAERTSDNGGYDFFGGNGYDILDFRALGDVRWEISVQGSNSNRYDAYEIDGNENRVFDSKAREFERYILGDNDDEITMLQNGSFEIDSRGGDDTIVLFDGNTIINAGDGDDRGELYTNGIFYGGNGDDFGIVNNGGANNTLYGGSGVDFMLVHRTEGTIYGGADYDVLAVDTGLASVDINFTTKRLTSSDGRIDAHISGFQEAIGSESADRFTGTNGNQQFVGWFGNDVIFGIGGEDKLFGGAGTDKLYGGDGDDLLHGGAGTDSIFGGQGRDTVSYTYAAPDTENGELAASNFGGVTVLLSEGADPSTAFGSAGRDYIFDVENVFGSGGDDQIVGNSESNVLTGENGSDTLSGDGGDDFLVTGKGNDTAYGGSGDDSITVDIGEKEIFGGVGRDTLDLGAIAGVIQLDFRSNTYDANFDRTKPVWVDTGTSETRAWNGTDYTPNMVQDVNPLFSDEVADTSRPLPNSDIPSQKEAATMLLLTQVSVADNSSGVFEGIDVVKGGIAEVRIKLSTSLDRYDGTDSSADFLDFESRKADLKYNMANGSTNSSFIVGDELLGIDGIYSGSGDDSLTGNSGDNTFYGADGDDRLYGGGGDDHVFDGKGDDRVYLGSGDDYVRAGGGKDSFYGGSGKDYISYRISSGGVEIDLTKQTAKGSWAVNDIISGFESASGSENGDDMIRGTDGANRLKGYAGNDDFFDMGGDDSVSMGDGNDYIRVGGGKDSFYGGGGKDYISYYDSSNGVELNLEEDTAKGSWAVNDIIRSFESASGSRTGDDKITGTESSNTIRTYGGDDDVFDLGGDDKIELGSGNDYVRVGGGRDSYDGGSGKDYISYFDSTNGVTVNLSTDKVSRSWASNDIVKNFESVGGSEKGGDLIFGSSVSNTIRTYGGEDSVYDRGGDDFVSLGSGDDYVRVGGGKDKYYGGSGSDYISYFESSNGVTLDLQANAASGSWASNDVVNGFENATGSGTGDDELRGTSGNNRLRGSGGDDSLYGRSGADTLYGGSGHDYLDGGNSADLLYGGSGRDIFHFDFDEGDDKIKDFENNIDVIEFHKFEDFDTAVGALTYATQVGNDVYFDFGTGGTLLVEDVTKGQLQNDIEFG